MALWRGCGIWKPVPAVCGVAVAAMLLTNGLDVLTDMQYVGDTSIDFSGLIQLYGWDLPPLHAAYHVLNVTQFFWMAIPLSFVLRMQRSLPVDVLRLLRVRGLSESGIVCDVLVGSLVHALVFWAICAGAALAFMSAFCRGSCDPVYVTQLWELQFDQVVTVDAPLAGSAALCAATYLRAALPTLIVAATLVKAGREMVALGILPVLYGVETYLLSWLIAYLPQEAMDGFWSMREVLAMPFFLNFESEVLSGALVSITVFCLQVAALGCVLFFLCLKGSNALKRKGGR